MEQKNLELAKSWFVLAQLFIVFSGFIGVAIGLLNSTSSIYTDFETSYQFCDRLKEFNNTNYSFSDCYKDSNQAITKNMNATLELSNFFIMAGIIAVINSIFCWVIGRTKLENPFFKDKFALLVILLVDIIMIIFFYLIRSSP